MLTERLSFYVELYTVFTYQKTVPIIVELLFLETKNNSINPKNLHPFLFKGVYVNWDVAEPLEPYKKVFS